MYTPLWIRHRFLALGITLVLSGCLYLTAFNWVYMPAWLKLGLPQLALISCCGGLLVSSLSSLSGRALAFSCVIFIGLCLAVYGQVYQTGADAYQLFLTWALFVLPWLRVRQAGIAVLFWILLQLSWWLWSQQQFLLMWPDSWFVAVSLLSTCVLLLYISWVNLLWLNKAWVRWFLLLPILLLGFSYFWLELLNQSGYLMQCLAPGFTLLLLRFYQSSRPWFSGVASCLLFLCLLVVSWLSFHIIDSGWHDLVTSVFLTAILILGSFLVAAQCLKFLSRELPSVYLELWLSLLQGIGAWLTALFTTLWLVLAGYFTGEVVFIVLGLLSLCCGAWLYRTKNSLFWRQFTLALALSGQGLIYIGLIQLPMSVEQTLFLCQLILAPLCYFVLPNLVFRICQGLALAAFAPAIAHASDVLMVLSVALLLFFPRLNRDLLHTLAATVLALMLTRVIPGEWNWSDMSGSVWVHYGYSLLVGLLCMLALTNKAKGLGLVWPVLMVSLLTGSAALLVSFMVMFLAKQKSYLTLFWFSHVAFAIYLFHYYYQLNVGLTAKGLSILATGFCLVLCYLYTRRSVA